MNIQEIIKKTYANTKQYVRDVDLDDNFINIYKPGDIIYERAFIDCTKKIGGLDKKVRYSIISNQAKDLSEFEKETNWGLCVIDRNSAFKVLDIYKKSKKTLIVLLHIPVDVAEEFNKVHTNFDEELIKIAKEEFEKYYNQPSLIEFKENWYDRLILPIGIDNNLNYYSSINQKPTITKENIYDENKMIIDLSDRRRIIKNINKLKKEGIAYNQKMGKIPTNATCNIMSKKEIYERLIKDYTIATLSLNISNGKKQNNKDIIKEMNKKYDFENLLTDEEKDFLDALNNDMLKRSDVQDLQWLYIDCNIYLYILKLIKNIPSVTEETKKEEIEKILNGKKKLSLKTLKLRKKSEIMEYADLVFRYNYACQLALKENKVLLNPMVIQEQKNSLEKILNWNLDKIKKPNINVRYQFKNFDFEFKLPTNLEITKTKENESDDELLILESKDQKIRMCFLDLGPTNDLEKNYEIIKEDLKDQLEIKEETEIPSKNLGTIKNIFGQAKNTGISQFHFLLNGHYIRVDCLLGKDINFEEMDEVHKSISNIYAIKILLSIKNNLTEKIATENSYKMHAEGLYIPVLENLKIEKEDNPQVILSANGNGYREQLISEGLLTETFEQRIDLIVNNTIENMKKTLGENSDNKMFFYKDYNNDFFDFKIYAQDMILTYNHELKAVRQFNAFFVDKKYNDFYQLVLSAGPISIPNDKLILGKIDLEKDLITKKLDKMLTLILDDIKYNDFRNVIKALEKSASKISDDEETKDLYKIILTCGQFNEPLIDEHNIKDFLNNKDDVIKLIENFDNINKEHFNNKLPFKIPNSIDNLLKEIKKHN